MEKTALSLQKRGHKVWIFSHPDSEFTRKASDSLNLIPFRIGNENNPVILFKLIKFIKRNNIQVLVSNIKKESVICARAAKKMNIVHIRRIGNEKDLNHPAVQRLYKRSMVDVTITPCEDVITKVVGMHDFVGSSDFACIHNGRNPQSFSDKLVCLYKKEFSVPEDGLILGVLCQLVIPKNIPGIIRTFRNVLKTHPDTYLVVAGKGPEEDNIRKMIAEYDIKDRCLMIGFVKDTLKFSALTDIGILFSDIEGFSNSVVEFMSVGTPVICTDVGGQREIVRDGLNGFLVEPGDERALEQKILELLSDKSKLDSMGKRAFDNVKNEFSEDGMINKIEQLYQKKINKKGKIKR